MDRTPLYRLELRHLRAFLLVAEELNVTRAAARLGIAQPALSLQIARLEDAVGAKLFRRLPRGMATTEAGVRLLADGPRVFETLRSALADAKRAALGELGAVRIGFTSSASFNPFVTEAISDYRTAYPGVQVELMEDATARLLDLARGGRVDAAFLRPAVAETAGLDARRLFHERMVAVLPARHAARDKSAIDIAALRDETFVLYPRANGPAMYDAIVGACRAAGFDPKIGQSAPQMASTINLVAAGIGVSIVPASMAQLAARGVVYKRIRGRAPKADLWLVRPRESGPRAGRNFADLVVDRVSTYRRSNKETTE